MRTNNRLFVLLSVLFVLICVQCTKEKTPDPPGSGDPDCKFNEEITSSLTGFMIFDTGAQGEGIAEGVKINIPWEASAFLSTDASGNHSLVLRTYHDSSNSSSLVAEQVFLRNIVETEAPLCYRLAQETHEWNEIAVEYIVHISATHAIHYKLDTTAINEFEVTRFSIADSIVEGRFCATFITETPDAPGYPEQVQFINVQMEVKFQSNLYTDICIGPEPITATDTGFYIFEPGTQTEGSAEGVKINLPWTASAFIFTPDPQYGHSLTIKTYWEDELGASIRAELFYIANIPLTSAPLCFDLTNDETATDKVFCWYRVSHDDQPINSYTLDTMAVNKIEVKRFNLEERIFEGKFMASFITNDPRPPGLPERVRFFNVDIRIGVD